MRFKEIYSIPNILCYIRFLLIGWFLSCYFHEEYMQSAWIIALGGVTDFFDGQIARRCHMITRLGKILDPLADKAMQLAIAIALVCRYRLMICLLILFIVKEAFQGICCIRAYRKGKKLDGALWFGKIATATFYILAVMLIAVVDLPLWLADLGIVMVMIALLFAFVMYGITFYRMAHE